jgi:hypothetical protein
MRNQPSAQPGWVGRPMAQRRSSAAAHLARRDPMFLLPVVMRKHAIFLPRHARAEREPRPVLAGRDQVTARRVGGYSNRRVITFSQLIIPQLTASYQHGPTFAERRFVLKGSCTYRLCHPNVVPMETAEPSD